MHICLLEPYYGGSHRAWTDGFIRHTRHTVTLLTMPAQFWKWRMQGGAVTMARLFAQQPRPDLILASDMLDLSIFRAITRTDLPIALYFHENQLSYPQNRRQGHGWRYGFINYASALAADALYFNSQFHLDDFFAQLPRMLKHFADFNELHTVDQLREKARVLPLGLDLKRFDTHGPPPSPPDSPPLILWNHRWEADKDPETFFAALNTLDDEGFDFRLALLGENFRQQPAEFEAARQRYGERIVHYGYAESFADYARILWHSDYAISTSYQDFFGISVTEAIYCQTIPILANRLNYPHLIPPEAHDTCLFRDGALTGLLRQHLLGSLTVDTAALKHTVARYDWTTMIDTYDAELESMLS